MNGARAVGSEGDDLSNPKWQWAPAAYLVCLLVMNILSTPFAPDVMPDECDENSRNCDHRLILLDVGEEELHKAMEEWADSRGFTTTFSEGHIVDRTLFMQFPDDVTYLNQCGWVEVHSESRLGGSDFGVNSDRIDDLEGFLLSYEFETTCQ